MTAPRSPFLTRLTRWVLSTLDPMSTVGEPDVLGDALRTSEARYRGIVETQQATVMRLDFTGRILFVNEYCCEFVGMARADVIGRAYADWVHADDRDALVTAMAELGRPPFRARGISRVMAKGGVYRSLEWEAATIRDVAGTPVELQSIGRDVTERLQMEQALRESLAEIRDNEETLRLLARHQTAIREEERRRLSFDLHDGVCQELVGVGILIEGIRRRLEPIAGEVANELGRATDHLKHLGDHVRDLATKLRPMLLHDLGLDGALRSLAAGLATERLRIDAIIPTPVPRLEEQDEVAVYRIAQEAVTNAVRHAEADTVAVVLDAADGRLRLEVRDDGRGFDPAGNGRRPRALGILAMRERALALGGRFEVRSVVGSGTTVLLECPLHARAS